MNIQVFIVMWVSFLFLDFWIGMWAGRTSYWHTGAEDCMSIEHLIDWHIRLLRTGLSPENRWQWLGNARKHIILQIKLLMETGVPSKVDPQSLGRYQTVPGMYPLPLKCNILGKSREPAQALSGLSPARNACFVHVKKDERRAKCVESKPSLRKRISGSN